MITPNKSNAFSKDRFLEMSKKKAALKILLSDCCNTDLEHSDNGEPVCSLCRHECSVIDENGNEVESNDE